MDATPTISAAGRQLRSGETSATRLTQAALERIAQLNPLLSAFVHTEEGHALDEAARADAELQQGRDRGPLHGIPYGLKDIIYTAGMATTCHSKLMATHVPEVDATVVSKLRSAGAVLVGKLATHEFGLGGPSFDLPFPPARNPWSPDHFPGGSSSGSGVAVAAALVPLAIGSDTSGSIRGPAFHCGVVGVKPTYGLVSRRGMFPLSYSLDHCGPLTWTVEDAALALQAIAGFDPYDSASVDVPLPDYSAGIGSGAEGLRVAFARSFYAESPDVDGAIVEAIDHAIAQLASLGATRAEVDLPDFELFDACGRVIMAAEAFAIHEADLRTRPGDYGRYTYQRIAPGAGITAADLIQAQRLRRELSTAVNRDIFQSHDVLVTASSITMAPRLDAYPPDWPPKNTMRAIAFSVTGNPVLAVPVGFGLGGLPIGLQMVGRAFDEATLFRVGRALEQAIGSRGCRPAILGVCCARTPGMGNEIG